MIFTYKHIDYNIDIGDFCIEVTNGLSYIELPVMTNACQFIRENHNLLMLGG